MAGHGLIAAGLVLLAAVAPSYAVDYTVGDSSGWASGVGYSTWANGKTFNVGDTLVFQYSMMHTVAEVSSADYSACSASNSIQSYSDQNTKIALTKPGTRYFICGTSGHCASGMKLAVTVSPAATTATPASPPEAPATTPTAPSATPSEPGTDTPSETTPSTSTPAATTTTPSTTTASTDSTGGASGNEARFVMGLIVGAVGLVSLLSSVAI